MKIEIKVDELVEVMGLILKTQKLKIKVQDESKQEIREGVQVDTPQEHRAHAKLAPSAAKRWLTCPASVQLEEQFEDETTAYAEEGTAAHKMAELMLQVQLGLMTKEVCEGELLRECGAYDTPEMREYVQGYVDCVMNLYEQMAKANMMIEQHIDLDTWVPESFGTSDVVIVGDDTLHIVDLKYGMSRVAAANNEQLRLYALGAYEKFGGSYNIQEIKMTIVQPRLNHIDTASISTIDLIEWGENYVKPRAQEAFNGSGKFEPSLEACRYCKARHTCKHRAEKQLELQKYDAKEAAILTDEELGEILNQADELFKWVKDINEYCLKKAIQDGVSYPGWHLKKGRSSRRYKDSDEVAKVLQEAGYGEDLIYEKSLLTISAMEKIVGKNEFKILLGDLIVKPEGKPVLVPVIDKNDIERKG